MQIYESLLTIRFKDMDEIGDSGILRYELKNEGKKNWVHTITVKMAKFRNFRMATFTIFCSKIISTLNNIKWRWNDTCSTKNCDVKQIKRRAVGAPNYSKHMIKIKTLQSDNKTFKCPLPHHAAPHAGHCRQQ